MGVLKVKLVKSNHLKDQDFIGKSDPYCVLALEQDNVFRDKDYGYQKSSVKKNDCNPVWNEEFQFNNIPTLDNLVLTLTIKDQDIGSKDDKMGHCKIHLEKEGITSASKRIEKVVDRNIIRANGTVTVDVSYHP